MRVLRSIALASLLALAAAAGSGCIVSRQVNLGVPDRAARADLSLGTIAFCMEDGLYLARGDGSGAKRLVARRELGRNAAAFMPAISPAAGHVLFLSVADLDVRESTGRDLALNILELAGPVQPGAEIVSWRRARLEKIAPPDPGGRQEIFAVAGAAWAHDGRRLALGLNRSAQAGGDAVMVFDVEARPLSTHGLGGRDLAHVSALSWTRDGAALVLGLEGEVDSPGIVSRLELPDVAGARAGIGARLTDLAPGRYPVLSPDGERIAVVDESSGQQSLVLLDMTGGEISRFERPAGRALNRPFWSPDGRYLYYYSLASTGPLGLVDITILRCLDIRTRQVYDLLRLG